MNARLNPLPKDLVLIIEDEADILELVRYNLERDGFRVAGASSGEDGFQAALEKRPCLIILDVMLPGIQGLEVCRLLRGRSETRRIPIIMLTARDSETDVVLGLELGADDYVTKPFSVRELCARVRAVLRRARTEAPRFTEYLIRLGPLEIDRQRHEVRLEGEKIDLTLAQFRLLSVLSSNPGRVLTRDQLLDHITGGTSFIIDRNVDVHVRSIRKALGTLGNLIVTVRGVGYKCEPPDESR